MDTLTEVIRAFSLSIHRSPSVSPFTLLYKGMSRELIISSEQDVELCSSGYRIVLEMIRHVLGFACIKVFKQVKVNTLLIALNRVTLFNAISGMVTEHVFHLCAWRLVLGGGALSGPV